MIKALRVMGIGGTCLSITKAVYDRPSANTVLSGA